VLFQALNDLIVESGKFPDLVFQNFLHLILSEFAQILEANEGFIIEVGDFLFDELEKRRPNQFGDHAVLR